MLVLVEITSTGAILRMPLVPERKKGLILEIRQVNLQGQKSFMELHAPLLFKPIKYEFD